MPHAVFVRRPSDQLDPLPKALATDLDTRVAARELAEHLAHSYACHGEHDETGVLWFRDQEGLAEIWPQRQ